MALSGPEFLESLRADLGGHTVASAESCTGGNVAAALTSLPGSSRFFWGGVVAYSEAAKISLLGVSPQLIASAGVVSAEVAEAMAEAVREKAQTSFGLGVTGFAGPSGGTERDPVGTVYLAVAGPNGSVHQRLTLSGERPEVISQATWKLLQLLRLEVRKLNP